MFKSGPVTRATGPGNTPDVTAAGERTPAGCECYLQKIEIKSRVSDLVQIPHMSEVS